MASIELLLSDAIDLGLSVLNSSTWGVYLDGNAVIQPASIYSQTIGSTLSTIQSLASLVGSSNIVPTTASTVEFEFAQDWPISTYPQEAGAFQAYDKVTLPYDVKMRLASNGNGGGASARQGFLSTCLAISNSFSLFDIVTPEMTFTSCNVTHIDWRRSADRGATLIVVDMWFKKVPVSASSDFSNTQQPGEAGQQSLGNVQSQSTDQSSQQSIISGGVN